MSEITAAAVKQLRDRTDLPMMDCKKALTEAGGDMDKAIDILRSKFKSAVTKRADRETAEGRISVYYDDTQGIGSIVEIRCESAPVAKSEHFVAMCGKIAHQIAAQKDIKSVEDLLKQAYVGDKSKTIEDLMTETIGLLQENMKIARFTRLVGKQGNYVHHDGSVGAALVVEGEKAEPQLLRDICMHITATNPLAGSKDEIPAEVIAKEREIALAQTREDPKMADKSAEIQEKSVQGKLNKWLAQNSLLEQPFVKDESKTISQLLKSANLKFVRFVRYRVGEK